MNINDIFMARYGQLPPEFGGGSLYKSLTDSATGAPQALDLTKANEAAGGIADKIRSAEPKPEEEEPVTPA